MKLLIDIDEYVLKHIKAHDILLSEINGVCESIADGIPVADEDPIVTECRNTAAEKDLPLYFIYHEETGIIEIYITATGQLFEQRHTSKHLSAYEFKQLAENYINAYHEESLDG